MGTKGFECKMEEEKEEEEENWGNIKKREKKKKDRTKYLYNFLIEKDKIKNIMNVVFVVCSILKVKKNCTNSIILV